MTGAGMKEFFEAVEEAKKEYMTWVTVDERAYWARTEFTPII
jgi:hypothetical protein